MAAHVFISLFFIRKSCWNLGKNYWHSEKCVENFIVNSDIIQRVLCNSRTIKSHKIERKKRIGMQKGNHIEQQSINYSDSYVVCSCAHNYTRYVFVTSIFRFHFGWSIYIHIYFHAFFVLCFFCYVECATLWARIERKKTKRIEKKKMVRI